jgi:D-threo-aldose 1-dehydrogenase
MSTRALFAASTTPGIDVLMVAGRFTLLEQSIVPEVVDSCETNHIDLVVASIFNSGLLATDEPESHNRFDYGSVPTELMERVVRIRNICRDHQVELPTAALHFAARAPRARAVIIAGSRPEQIVQSAQRMRDRVPDDLWINLAAERLIPAVLP